MSQQNKTLKVGFAQNSYTSDIAGNQAINAKSIRDPKNHILHQIT